MKKISYNSFYIHKRFEKLKEDREKVAEAEEMEKEAAEAEVTAPEVKPVRRRLIEESLEETEDGADKKTKMLVSGKILERMVSQNSCFEIAQGIHTKFTTSVC